MPHKFETLSEHLLFEILSLGVEINYYDFDLFVEYLKDPNVLSSYSNKQQETKYKSRVRNEEEVEYWNECRFSNGLTSISANSLVEKYLENFFKTRKSIQPFDEYLDTDSLRVSFNRVTLFQGKQP